MQRQYRANSSFRAKALVAKTKGAIGSMFKAIKSLEITSPSRKSTFKPLPASTSDEEDEVFRPSPTFARRSTSTSQCSRSTGSTTVTTISSRYTYKSNTTAASDSDHLDGDELAQVIVRRSAGQSPVKQEYTPLFSIELESDDDYPCEEWDGEDDEAQVPLIRSKRGEITQAGFITSLPHNPYASFLSQPLYKQPYMLLTNCPS
ncbi:hypothetical protein FRC01_011841 [Tulasnella sp. 417]|nr:hypothetical protein FRC01_011841 [Tulasnella sp. 417]